MRDGHAGIYEKNTRFRREVKSEMRTSTRTDHQLQYGSLDLEESEGDLRCTPVNPN